MKDLYIFGTLGPACHEVETIMALFRAGATGMRLNLSHGNLAQHADWIANFHIAAKRCGVSPQLLIDMQGPELRTSASLSPLPLETDHIVMTNTLGFPDCVRPYLKTGVQILVDDGRILLETVDHEKSKVLRGGLLLPRKSITIQHVSIPLPVLTKEDFDNLSCAAQYGVTGIMQPFVRSTEDLIKVRAQMDACGLKNACLYAKIESKEGIAMAESLLPYCDELIIARGDLADSVGLVHLASAQHDLEKICRRHEKPYMIVTQMLHSMMTSPIPTRAEISDIYHAVYNGASSIMLTGETASGSYPVEAMNYFAQTAYTALKDREDGTF